jgi:hypothetical protein
MPPTAEEIARQIRKYCKIFTNSKTICKTLSLNKEGFSIDNYDIYEKWDDYNTITGMTPPPNHVIMLDCYGDILVRLIWEPQYCYYDKTLRFQLPVTATYYKFADRLEISYKHNYFSREEAKLFKLPDNYRDIPQISILKGPNKEIVPDEILAVKNKITI